MNFIDYILLIITALFMILGYRKGIIISLATIVALLLGIYASAHFSNYLDGVLLEHLKPSQKWLPILSFSFTFLLVLVGVLLVGKLVEKLVDVAGLGFVNRLLGALLGGVKGILLASVLFFIVVHVDDEGKWLMEKHKQESYFYRQVAGIVPSIMELAGGRITLPEL
jgi:membrane protein required for colicin V production